MRKPPNGFKARSFDEVICDLDHLQYTHKKRAKRGFYYWSEKNPDQILHEFHLSDYARSISFKQLKVKL
jgi:hypothetical protein